MKVKWTDMVHYLITVLSLVRHETWHESWVLLWHIQGLRSQVFPCFAIYTDKQMSVKPSFSLGHVFVTLSHHFACDVVWSNDVCYPEAFCWVHRWFVIPKVLTVPGFKKSKVAAMVRPASSNGDCRKCGGTFGETRDPLDKTGKTFLQRRCPSAQICVFATVSSGTIQPMGNIATMSWTKSWMILSTRRSFSKPGVSGARSARVVGRDDVFRVRKVQAT